MIKDGMIELIRSNLRTDALVSEIKGELKELEAAKEVAMDREFVKGNDQDRADLREMLRLAREVSEGKTYVYQMIEAAMEIEKRAQARWGK